MASSSMSELVKDWSWLQLLWAGKAAVDGFYVLYLCVSGSFWDKSQGDREAGAPVGWLQFRKRMIAQQVLAAGCTGWLMWQATGAYVMEWTPSDRLQHIMELAATPKSSATIDASCLLVGGGLFLFHTLRRLQECSRVSIFSMRQTLNPISALLHYVTPIAASLSLLAEAPAMQSMQDGFQVSSLIGWKAPLGFLLYLLGSKLQHYCFAAFARLRRNRAGHIVTTGYRIPKGGWFDQISSPHYLGEICIYSGVGLILGSESSTWWYLTGSVAMSQYLLALCTHRLYRKKFEDYPTDRKALIPYVL